jgi:predicted phage baseplate assembly protein
VQEVLGGGDGSRSYQRFTLRQPPLTYVNAANASGADSTLEVRVNDVLWHEVPDLFGHGPDERIFVTRLDDEAKTTVIFGDGQTGARLPTGQENVKAKYRKGIGLGGLVRADQLTQLMTRPLGVKSVTNPLPADGAADREQLDEARSNAPLTILTLGRIVSLQDYQDFARAFSGIAKALATWTWFGETRGVFVTVAGAQAAEIKSESNLYKNLLQGMISAGDPSVPLLVRSYQPQFFRLSIALSLDPDYLRDKVFGDVELKLRERFSFAARDFGQPVQLSEVISFVQSVAGVVAVVIKEFYRADKQAGPKPPPRLEAAVPRPGDQIITPAEILILDPRPLGLEELK